MARYSEIQKITLDIRAGANINWVAEEALATAQRHQVPVEFNFNGVDMTVKKTETVKNIVNRWTRKFDYDSHKKEFRILIKDNRTKKILFKGIVEHQAKRK